LQFDLDSRRAGGLDFASWRMAVWRAPSVPCVEGVLESLALRQADDGKRTAAAKGAATEGWSRGSPLRMARAYPSSPPIPLRGGEVWYSTFLT
jgi:hypothetical protein